jgi:predicted RNA-binding Zn-ribbon protein involved in translation (DUF1610 family)
MILEAIEKELERYDLSDYDDILNSEGTVTVCGMEFYPADILKELDPISYNVGFNDMQEYDIVYECPMCGEEHEDEEDAKNCCQTIYECPMCGEEHDSEEDADNCCKEEEEEEEEEDEEEEDEEEEDEEDDNSFKEEEKD